MDLQHYLEILKRRAFVILMVMITTIGSVGASDFLIPPEYTARATVRVLLDVGLSDFILRNDYTTRLMNTYVEVVSTNPFLEKALERLSHRPSSLSVSSLKRSITVEMVPNTELISIAVRYRDPAVAQELANTLSALLVDYSQDLYVGNNKSTRQIVEEQLMELGSELESDRQNLERLKARNQTSAEVNGLARQIEIKEEVYARLLDRYESARLNEAIQANRITIIGPAAFPTQPSNATGLQDIILAGIIGLFGGFGLALILENLDPRIYTVQQLEHLTDIPILGVVPDKLLSLDDLNNVSSKGHNQPHEEAFRLLSTNLTVLSQKATPYKTLLITTAISEEGKSFLAINLARTLADQGKSVFLVESDMRHPVIGEMFDIKKGPVLGTLLVEQGSLNNGKLQRAYHPAKQSALSIIPSGPVVENPAPLFASSQMQNLLDQLHSEVEITLLNAPPVLGFADTSILASKVDAILLVVKEGHSRRGQLQEALKQLQTVQARVIGTVFVQKGTRNRIYG